MAKANRKTIRPAPVTTVVLELDMDEAVALHDLTRMVSGNQITSRRRFTERVCAALRDASVPHTDRLSGSLEFWSDDEDDDLPF